MNPLFYVCFKILGEIWWTAHNIYYPYKTRFNSASKGVTPCGSLSYIWRFVCKTRVSLSWTHNYCTHYSVECNYLCHCHPLVAQISSRTNNRCSYATNNFPDRLINMENLRPALCYDIDPGPISLTRFLCNSNSGDGDFVLRSSKMNEVEMI